MRPLSDYLFALLVALFSGGCCYLAHWALLLLLARLGYRRIGGVA